MICYFRDVSPPIIYHTIENDQLRDAVRIFLFAWLDFVMLPLWRVMKAIYRL